MRINRIFCLFFCLSFISFQNSCKKASTIKKSNQTVNSQDGSVVSNAAGTEWTDQDRGDATVACLKAKGDITLAENNMACQCIVKLLEGMGTYNQFVLNAKGLLGEAEKKPEYKTCYDELVAKNKITTPETTAPSWTKPELLENNNESDAALTAAVFNIENSALVVWAQSSAGKYNIWGKAYMNGFWQQSLPIAALPGTSNQPFSPLALAYTGSGQGVVIWDSYGVDTTESTYLDLYSTIFTPSVGWALSTPTGVSTVAGSKTHEYHPTAASNCKGDVLTAWMEDKHGIWVNRYKDKVGWEKPVRVSADISTGFPLIACDVTGAAIVAWGQGSSGGPMFSTLNATTNTWSTPAQAGPALPGAINSLTVAGDGKGRMMIVWGQADSATNTNSLYFTSSTEAYSQITTLNSNLTAGQPWNTEVATDTNGNLMVAWFNVSAEKAVWSSFYSATTGKWQAPVQVNQGAQSASTELAGVYANTAGQFHITWLENTGSTTLPMWSHWETNAWSAKTAIYDQNLVSTDRNMNLPQLVFDRKGTALMFFRKYEGDRYNLYAMFYK